jgi:hypothetical protein
MKPKNFPERKRQRRIRALVSLMARKDQWMSLDQRARWRQHVNTLNERIGHESQRGVRTKKRRVS